MKHLSLRVLTVAFCLSASWPLGIAAQASVGIRAGYNFATFGGGPVHGDDSYEYRGGINVASFFDFPLSRRFGLQVGAGYSGKGAGDTIVFEGETVEWKIPIGYLELPALLRFQLLRGSRFSPHLFIGPTLSIRTSCSQQLEGPGLASTTGCGEGNLEVRDIDVGLTGGLGVRVPLSEQFALAGDAFYSHGLRPLAKQGDSARNRVFSIALGLAVPVG